MGGEMGFEQADTVNQNIAPSILQAKSEGVRRVYLLS
jgi:hypothetical protein